MRCLMWFGAVALLSSPVIAWSQEAPAIVPGARIRITEAGSSARRSGTVVTAGGDTVVLKLDGGGQAATVPLARISALEVSRGQHGHTGAGIGLGFLAGAGVGAGLGAIFAPAEASQSEEGNAVYVAFGAAVGAGAGMLIGGIAGASHKTESWVPSSDWHVSALPTGRGGFSIALSVRF